MINPELNWYFEKPGRWQELFILLREYPSTFGLKEKLKWGHPCYIYGGKMWFSSMASGNLLHYCSTVLVKDPYKILAQQTQNVQFARQIRFTSMEEIAHRQEAILEYIREAVENEKTGKKLISNQPGSLKCPKNRYKRWNRIMN